MCPITLEKIITTFPTVVDVKSCAARRSDTSPRPIFMHGDKYLATLNGSRGYDCGNEKFEIRRRKCRLLRPPPWNKRTHPVAYFVRQKHDL